MMDRFKQECKLCENIISDENFEVIEDVTESMFNTLLLKLTLNKETQNVVCTACSLKLLAALNFKSTCLDTEDTLFPYINFENPEPLDLKEIYAKEKESRSVLDDQEVCRLCLQQSSDHKSIEEVPVDDIQIYIPEIDFTVTVNPVICMKCHDELCVHSSFLKNCLEVEKKRNVVAMDVEDVLLTDSHIKTEEIEIIFEPIGDFTIPCDMKQERHDECDASSNPQDDPADSKNLRYPDDLKATSSESTSSNCSHFEIATSESRYIGENKPVTRRLKAKPYKCVECQYKTRDTAQFTQHLLLHKDPSDIKTYQCDVCDYKCLQKVYLEIHQLRHKHPCDVRMYQCDVCDYKSSRKDTLKTHQLRHKDPCDVPLYECDVCDYKSLRKDTLKFHQLRHMDPCDVPMYECDVCDYKSIRKDCLRAHEFIHKDPATAQMYQCDQCDYKCIRKDYLTSHEFKHKDPATAQTYQCDQCDYECLRKYSLKVHQRKHKDPCDVKMYQCDVCEFITRYKKSLARHRLKHTNHSEIKKYECGFCEYKSGNKGHLKTHQLRHMDPCDVQMYQCDGCQYKTKYKGDLKKHGRSCATRSRP